jgi:pseudouridine synthase
MSRMKRPKAGEGAPKARWRAAGKRQSQPATTGGRKVVSDKAPDNPVLKTLDRVISKAGAGSRTEARQWIGTGRVQVNGKVIQTPNHWVDLQRDKVSLDGKPLVEEKKRYVLLYKPKGFLTTYKDPDNRPTVYDLIAGVNQFLANVGRLDKDTSGLLLLTNDTHLAERLTNPDYHVPKTYLVKAATLLTDDQLERLRRGVELDDGPTRPAEVVRIRDNPRHTFLEITITEGRNRQVRRMLDAVESGVLKLVRTRIGPLTIGELEIGKWRDLTAEEIRLLRASRRS